MKIIGTTKLITPCLWTCIGNGIKGLEKYTNIPVLLYDQYEIEKNNIRPDNDDVIIIAEAGCFQHAGWSLQKVKQNFPNSKIVILGTDTNIYLFKHKRHQVDYSLVDLWLDLDTRCVEVYNDLNVNSSTWMWTTSDWFIEYIKTHDYNTKQKDYDFIGVYHIATLNNGYRKQLLDYIKNNNLKFTNGGGNGHEDNDIHRLLTYYSKSFITLGTTSHNIPNFRTPKGFRDWIGPLLDSVLIYDDYQMIIDYYGDNVLYYEYDNLNTIIELYNRIKNSNNLRMSILDKQKKWIKDNTIDKQLYKRLIQYGFISNK